MIFDVQNGDNRPCCGLLAGVGPTFWRRIKTRNTIDKMIHTSTRFRTHGWLDKMIHTSTRFRTHGWLGGLQDVEKYAFFQFSLANAEPHMIAQLYVFQLCTALFAFSFM